MYPTGELGLKSVLFFYKLSLSLCADVANSKANKCQAGIVWQRSQVGQGSMRTIGSGGDWDKLESAILKETKGGSNYPASMEQTWVIITSDFLREA